MITIFCDFCQFSAQKLPFSQKPMLWSQFLRKLKVVWAKNAKIFAKFFGENILKIITSVPGTLRFSVYVHILNWIECVKILSNCFFSFPHLQKRGQMIHSHETLVSDSGRPGTDFMIFKIFSPNNSAKEWRFWHRTKLNYATFCSWHWFSRKRQFFRRKLSKIADNCDHNIEPRLGEFSPF
jgi:hypothetical protein